MFTIQALSQNVNKLPITSIDLYYSVTTNHCFNEESISTVKQNNFQYPHHIITPCNINILYN